MKRLVFPVFILFFLSGCAGKHDALDKVLMVRSEVMNCSGVAFNAVITADYLDELYVFELRCDTNEQGDLSFQVVSPQTISGIAGTIAGDEGFLTFDDEVLAFEPLAEGRISPVFAPWVFIKTLRSGYIQACAQEQEQIIAVINDSYADNALQLRISINSSGVPYFIEIMWNQYRCISMEISDFRYV